MAQRFRPVIAVEGLQQPLKHCLRLRITQAIFDHHHFELVVPHETLEGPDTDGFMHQAHQQLCGKRINISLAPVNPKEKAPGFRFTGIITQLRLGSTNDLSNVYIIEGYSPTYLLEDSSQRRTFVKKTLPAISSKVLGDYDGKLLKSRVVPRNKEVIPYAVQYDENNFAFLKRLAATQGEWLYYTGTELVIGPPTEATPTTFVVGGVQSFSLTLSLRPSKFKATDYDYRQHQTMTASSAEQAAPGLGDLNAFALQASEALFPQAFHVGPAQDIRQPGQLNQALSQLKANLAGSLVVFEGVGETPDITLGKCLTVHKPGVEGSSAATDMGQYRVLSIEHWLDDTGNYFNQFRAVPEGRSALAPGPWLAQPPAGALELAEVIDTKDPKQLGRVRVRYAWPVARPQDAETGWLRVSTPYAGNGKGQLFTPEVGSQALIGYEQQHPEQPVVLGNLFHANNPAKAKYSHGSGGAEVKGIQTMAGNRITFLEKKGEEKIIITNGNQKETVLEISFKGKGKIELKTAGDISLSAGQNVSIEAGQDVAIKAKKKLVLEAEEVTSTSRKATAIKAGSKATLAGSSGVDVKGKLNQSA